MGNLVYGVGLNDKSEPTKTARGSGKQVLEYSLWKDTLRRCYSETSLLKHPTYVGCSVSEDFKDYTYFRDWCRKQIGFGLAGFELDKDLLFKGNKVYSAETCAFVPVRLNILIGGKIRGKGPYPIGVSKHRGKFEARLTLDNGGRKHLGGFNSPEEAFQVYKAAKEERIKAVVEKYRLEIDPRVYIALKNYVVEITD